MIHEPRPKEISSAEATAVWSKGMDISCRVTVHLSARCCSKRAGSVVRLMLRGTSTGARGSHASTSIVCRVEWPRPILVCYDLGTQTHLAYGSMRDELLAAALCVRSASDDRCDMYMHMNCGVVYMDMARQLRAASVRSVRSRATALT